MIILNAEIEKYKKDISLREEELSKLKARLEELNELKKNWFQRDLITVITRQDMEVLNNIKIRFNEFCYIQNKLPPKNEFYFIGSPYSKYIELFYSGWEKFIFTCTGYKKEELKKLSEQELKTLFIELRNFTEEECSFAINKATEAYENITVKEYDIWKIDHPKFPDSSIIKSKCGA
jgi:hypothetical protein